MYNNKTIFYIDYTLYKLNKIIIIFKNYCLINIKLFQPIFNNPKFFIRLYFVKCIWDYESAINYNMTYNKSAYKKFFKIFYRQTNKK